MQVCNLKKAFLFGICIFFNFCLFGQSITMPSMPKMPISPSMPTLGGEFYQPSTPTSSISSNTNSTNQKVENSSSETKNQTIISNSTNSNDIFTALTTNNSILSASDISSLYDSGLFDNFSSLNANISSNSSTVLLQQILTSLEELKNQQKNSSPSEKQNLQNVQMDSENFKQREPSILRFKINGYDIKDSLVKVFFSEPENDGSFLLSGDRNYFTNQKKRTETFYILFKTLKSNGVVTTFEVQPSIVQDFKNENSFVYRFANQKNLLAEKTGNLVVLHSSDNNLNVDLLLDIDKTNSRN